MPKKERSGKTEEQKSTKRILKDAWADLKQERRLWMGMAGILTYNCEMIYWTRYATSLYYDQKRQATYATISLVISIITIPIVIFLGWSLTKVTTQNNLDMKLLATSLGIKFIAGSTFVVGYRTGNHTVQDVSAPLLGINMVYLISFSMIGRGVANHTANAGVIFGLFSFSGFIGTFLADGPGSLLFTVSPDMPLLALVLPAILIVWICIMASLLRH